MKQMVSYYVLGLTIACLLSFPAGTTAQSLEELDSRVLTDDERRAAVTDFRASISARLRAANRASSSVWRDIKSREQWESFRDQRIAALRESVGRFGSASAPITKHVSATYTGDGFAVENIVFNSRPGVWITANLYRPASSQPKMPGIIICHSHHTPKTHGELQDMGMTWARMGCLVLVMDQLGHGERRQHSFNSSGDYPQSFRVSRQDYYFRYDIGIQLNLAGKSLVGHIAWDLSRGVDLLSQEPGFDRDRVILIGAVAGGGDPTAVAGALDRRFSAVVPFNFGGPQPETRYPLPDDAETSFNYAGSGSWESTRNLRDSAAGGFLPWVIVGGVAPRRLVFAHEFNWDRPRDPVWKRLESIYELYDHRDHLAYTTGRGELRGRPPESTHCTHVGKFHRRLMHRAFSTWFGLPDGEAAEYSQRRDSADLRCWTAALRDRLQPRALHQVLAKEHDAQGPGTRARSDVSARFSRLLGRVHPAAAPAVLQRRTEAVGESISVTRAVLETEPGIRVPLLLLTPSPGDKPAPAVVAVAQSGKSAVLQRQAGQIKQLLESGIAVCLPDVRGTGEVAIGRDRGRRSAATSLSSTALMTGDSFVASRLRDLRGTIAFLRAEPNIDRSRIGVWGISQSAANAATARLEVPHDVSPRPAISEPLGGLLALFAGLFDGELRAVAAHGALAAYRATLDHPFVHLPHDTVIPGVLPAGDLPTVAAAVSPTPLRLSGLVDGANRSVDMPAARSMYAAALRGNLTLADKDDSANWLIQQLAP